MASTFFEYVQPTIWMCNFFGYTYITARERGGFFRKLLEFSLPVPLLSLSYFIIANLTTMDTSTDKRYILFPNVTKISDIVGIAIGIFCLFIKSTYYLLYKETVRDTILQVLTERQM